MILSLKKIVTFLFVLLLLVGLVLLTRTSVDSSLNAATLSEEEIFLPLVINSRITRSVTSPFGVQIYGSSESGTKYYSDLNESGASWIRNMILWPIVEPQNTTPENYNWSYPDSVFAAARSSSGFNVIGNFDENPSWASTNKRGVINNLSEYTEFVGAMVERYDGDGFKDAPGSPIVTHWEFYNEPDRYNTWGDYPKEYAEMLKAVYPAVKGANPEAKVVFGGIAHDWFVENNGPHVREFLDGVLDNGGGPYFDVMNIHSYPVFSLVWADSGIGLIEKVESVMATLTKYGHGSKPMIITEAGWHSGDQPNWPSNQRLQSEYLVKIFAQSIAADVKIMIWWMFYDPGDHNFDNGLVTNGNPPQRKESFYTFQKMASKLENAEFFGLRRISTDDGSGNKFVIELYPFEGSNGRQFYITWRDPFMTNVDSGLSVVQRLAHSKVTLRDITTDEAIVINDADDGLVDGYVTFNTSARPIYVEVEN